VCAGVSSVSLSLSLSLYVCVVVAVIALIGLDMEGCGCPLEGCGCPRLWLPSGLDMEGYKKKT
jgi:hypothetical protein